MYKNYFRAIAMALATSVLATSCGKDEESVTPQTAFQQESGATEENLSSCTTSAFPFMNNRTQPAGVDNLGCETVSGLRTQKAAYWNAGHGVVGTSAVKEFLGMAMLEERTMNPANYVFGDKYPADDPVISRRNQPKTGYAANGGAIKQNVFALAVSIPNIRNVTNTSVRNASNCGQANVLCWDEVVNTLNTNRSWDVAKFNESKNYFAKIGVDWYRVHRGGASYITEPMVIANSANLRLAGGINGKLEIKTAAGTWLRDNGWTYRSHGAVNADVADYKRGVDWIRNNLFFSRDGNYASTNINNFPNMTNDARFWVYVKPI